VLANAQQPPNNAETARGYRAVVVCVFYKSKELLGNDLLSQEATPQVPSALTSLTAGFEMGPGVSSSLLSPKSSLYFISKVLTNLANPAGWLKFNLPCG
jgi:hypothetical protein